MKQYLILFILVLSTNWILAQPAPGNDECADADALACGDSFSASTDNVNTNTENTGCTVSDEGVWYTFTGDGNNTTISVTATSGWDHEINITSGSCVSLTNIACIDNALTDGTEDYTFTTTNGVTYYIYVSYWSSGGGTTGDFDISRTCSVPASAPANDDCSGAYSLTVNADFNCTSITAGTVDGATGSSQSTTDCSGTENNDVWFSFVATETSHTIDILNIAGSGTDMYHSVWIGTCPTLSLFSGSCSDPNSSTLAGLTPGTTYFIRVYEYYSDSENTTFDVCIGTAPPVSPCVADMTINSTTTSVNNLTTCGFGDDYSSSDACGSSYMNGDDIVIEYNPTTTGCIQIALTNTDTWTGLFVTDGCPDDPSVTCIASNTNSSGDPSINGLNVVAGTSYYITISTNPSPQCTDFDLDITNCPPPPANDDCSGAYPVTVNPDLLCTNTTAGTVDSATPSTQTDGSCSGTPDDDVWFSFVAVETDHTIEILNATGSVTDMYHSVWEGICPAISLVSGTCSDGDSQSLTGLTVGQTYYIKVYTYTSTTGQTTDFDVCVGTIPPVGPCTADMIINSTTASINNLTTCGFGDNYSSSDACGDSYMNGDDIVIEYTPTTTGCVQIALTNTDTWTGIFITDGCPDDPSATCIASNTNSSGDPSISGLNVVAGTSYYITVSTNPTPQCTDFDIDITDCPPPTAEDCAGGTTLCDDATFSGNSSGSGSVNDLNSTNDGCLSGENESSWYYFEATTSGNIELTISTGVDYDFAIWGPFTGIGSCPPSSPPLRCSYDGSDGDTGLAIGSGDDSDGSGAALDQWVNEINATAGDSYIMVIDNFTADGTSFTLDWTLSAGATLSCSLLPITFGDFNLTKMNGNNLLNWNTYSEIDNSHFKIQKLDEDGNFNTIGMIQGQSNSSGTTPYVFKDIRPENKVNIYRIVQIDFNGNETVFPPKSIDNSLNSSNLIGRFNVMGQEVNETYNGVVILMFKDGHTEKIYQIKE